MPFTLGFQECAFITVGFSIRATHRPLPGDVGTVRGADAAWLTPPVHLTLLPRPTVHILTRLYNSIRWKKFIELWGRSAVIMGSNRTEWKVTSFHRNKSILRELVTQSFLMHGIQASRQL